jgi:hypothetical protein
MARQRIRYTSGYASPDINDCRASERLAGSFAYRAGIVAAEANLTLMFVRDIFPKNLARAAAGLVASLIGRGAPNR